MTTYTSPTAGSPEDSIILVKNLSRRFGSRMALDQVSLDVRRGQVYGLVGGNGAGKTTLIKHLLGLLKPEQGSVHVFGRDPVADPVGVLKRIGYLSEDRDLPRWMRVGELMHYSKALFPTWDQTYAANLRDQFDLDPQSRIKNLSRGELAKTGLLVALAHRPELLVLDEPSSGLDPLVRRDILEAVIHAVVQEGRTVLFSSHLLDEIERASDHLVMMFNGRVVLSGTVDQIKASHHRLVLRFEVAPQTRPVLVGALAITGGGCEWTVLCNGGRPELAAAAAKLGARIVDEAMPSLDEIFMSRANRRETSKVGTSH